MENEAVLINKYESIERCINRINEEYEGNPESLEDYRKMDSIVLNLQRACEMATDVAMYVVTNRKLGIPQTKKEAFEKLYENNLISEDMCLKMKGMDGFRNIAIHEYKNIDEEILKDLIENHLIDIKEFVRQMINLNR